MKPPSHADAYEVLCLQAAADGRGEVLFGDSYFRARKEGRSFMIGQSSPDAYFEFPLVGDPFLDVTVLYGAVEQGMRIQSQAAAGTEELIDWYAQDCADYAGVAFGFELDTKNPALPAAAIHFQPRKYLEFVTPFCEAAGEPERAKLYLDLAERMPKSWPLSFFGMFRGRPNSPLRVCGYLDSHEVSACVNDSRHLADVFDEVGFRAYDDAMLEQVRVLMAQVPRNVDFQFDVYPDASLGTTFAVDLQFNIEKPEMVQESFSTGAAGRIMRLLEGWGACDERWKLAPSMAFARAIPVELDDGTSGQFAFTLMPRWGKARWKDGKLQPSKLYMLGKAKML